MGLFEYSALDQKGKALKGVIDADSLHAAKECLLKKKTFVTSIAPLSSKKKVHLSRGQVLEFTRDLNQLLGASLPLYDSLKAIEEKYAGSKHHALFVDLCDMVKQGKSLSEGLGCYRSSFNPVYISMCEAAEESGSLAVVFKELLKMMVKEDKLKKQLKAALLYPMFLASFCFIVVSGLFLFVIPSMKELLDGRELHSFTQAVLSLSDWLNDYFSLVFPLFIGGILGLIFYFRSEDGIRKMQAFTLRLPIIGKMKKESTLLKFCRTFSVLLASGVPVVKAIEMASHVMNHYQFEEVMKEAKLKLVEGKALSEVLSHSNLIPNLMTQMLATAEATGSMETMLASIADIYEDDLDKSIQQFSSLIQPVMILLLGLIVGVVLLAVLLPLTDVTSFID